MPPDFAPGPWAVTDAEYHQDTQHVGHSMLERFRENPRLYQGLYVTRQIPPPEPTQALFFGSVFHHYLLQPDTFFANYAIVPDGIDRRTRAGKEAWAQWQRSNPGSAPVAGEDWDRVREMANGCRRNPVACALLAAAGQEEQPCRWVDADTGLWLKAKPDKLFPSGAILDLKTCEDPAPEPFLRSAANYGYHRQAAFYLAGVEALAGRAGPFWFLAVGKQPPHEAVVHQLDEESLELGRRQVRRALPQLQLALSFDAWGSPWEARVQHGRLPGWAFAQEGGGG